MIKLPNLLILDFDSFKYRKVKDEKKDIVRRR